MRLGQLARKLATKPSEIVEFLAENNIHIEDGSNTKIDDNDVILITKRFAPAQLQVVSEVSETKSEPAAEINAYLEPVVQAAPIEEPSVVSYEIQLPLESQVPEENPVTEYNDVIKAPKITLTGLRVLGKIEIPEPKKKEKIEENTISAEEAPAKEQAPPQEARRRFNERKIEQRPRKNPIALAREKESIEEEKKRQAMAEREKIKRTQNYQKKVKIAPPTKALKLNREPVHEMSAADFEDTPKTLWGRFLKWLTS
jgi:hypothetical protein